MSGKVNLFICISHTEEPVHNRNWKLEFHIVYSYIKNISSLPVKLEISDKVNLFIRKYIAGDPFANSQQEVWNFQVDFQMVFLNLLAA